MRIGTAGWNLPKQHAGAFTVGGTHLQRYGSRFSAVEINSSFYRQHRPATYARWAQSVPAAFRFAVKMPREITHLRKLVDATGALERFLGEIAALGDRLGPILVQLPPKLAYDDAAAGAFFETLRARFAGGVVCEPRHPGWFGDVADARLSGFHVARAAADPAPVPRAAVPGGWPGIGYWRLHGSPRLYYSSYSDEFLDAVAGAIRAEAAPESWCIFDNTALGEAAGNALRLLDRLVC